MLYIARIEFLHTNPVYNKTRTCKVRYRVNFKKHKADKITATVPICTEIFILISNKLPVLKKHGSLSREIFHGEEFLKSQGQPKITDNK